MKILKFNSLLFFLVLIILTIPSIIPFFNPGFIVTDDGGWMIIRLSAFYDTIRDGQIPARFIERLNFGYGYPVANFLYPGYLYLGSVIHLAGFSFIDSVKILFSLSLVFSGIFSFIWLKRLFGNIDSLLGSLIYVYLPYHLFDVYKRGSLGEALSISVIPLAFYGIEKASTILIALSTFSILLFHNTLAVFFLPLIPIYALIRKSFVRSTPGMVLGVLMSAFFTVPALVELKYTKFLDTPISNPSEYFADIYLLGIISVVIFVSALILAFVIYREQLSKIPYRGLFVFFGIVFLISAFLSTTLSSFVWGILNGSFVQFPYRFLSLSLIAVAFMTGYISYILFGKAKLVFFALVIILLFIFSRHYLTEIEYENHPEEYYSTNDATTTVHDEYMPIWVKEKPVSRPENKVEVISGDAVIKNVSEVSNKIAIDLTVNTTSVIRVNTIYWPGWEVNSKGARKEINYENDKGVIEFTLEPFENRVILVFKDDLVRTLSNTASILAALFLIYYIARPLVKL